MSLLPLGASASASLSSAASSSSSSSLSALVAAAFAVATQGSTLEHIKGVDARWKAALASLLSLILDAARLDAAPSDLQSTLEDCGWPAGGAEVQAAARLYAQHKEALRIGGTHAIPPLPSLHTLSSTLYPSIIDVHWRVDDVVRADPAAPPSALHQPHYRLQLTTTTPGSAATTEYAFSCTLQQMQDLLSKLKDAQKQIQQKIE